MGVEADAPLRRGSRIKRPAARYVPEAESTDTRAAGRKRVHTETREDTKRAKSSTDDEEEEEEEAPRKRAKTDLASQEDMALRLLGA